jgi:hypothetical protein
MRLRERISLRALDVRFGPIATELMRRNETPLSAITGHSHCIKKALFDHLVGGSE